MSLTAKYATTCGVCAGSIAPGEQIAKAGTRWAHAWCAGEGQQSREFGAGEGGRASGSASGPAGSARKAGAPGRPASARTPAADPADPADGTEGAEGAAMGAALQVWTDGACSGNPGPGGWAWATKDGRRGSGGEAATTNQRMEIRAVLEAVRSLGGPLLVVSDSTYVVNCFRDGWWRGWLARGWVNSAKKPVANRDLWEPLIDVVRERGDITFRWVKGHSGDPMNELVDRLAVEAGRTVDR